MRSAIEGLESRRLLTGLVATGHSFAWENNHSLAVTFDKNVSPTFGPSDVAIENLTTGGVVADSRKAVSSAGNTFTTTISPILEDGNYESNVINDGIAATDGSTLASDHHLDFFVLGADANHDRVVNQTDQNILFANYGATAVGFSGGDFDYSGQVNMLDFNILAGRFGATLETVSALQGEISVFAPSSSQIWLGWAKQSAVDGYRVYQSTDGVSFTQIGQVPQPTTRTVDFQSFGLTDGTKYWYRVRPYTNAAGNGPSYERKWAVTTLPAPTNLTVSDVTDDQVALNWQDNSTTESGFTIQRSINGGAFENFATVGPNITTYTPTGLNENTNYSWRVVAGNSVAVSAASVSQAAVTKLKAVTAFDGWAFSKTQLQFSWGNESQVASDVVIDLKRYDGSLADSYTCAATAELFVISNLLEATTYRATMRAVDASNSSASSQEKIVTTAGRMYTNSGGLESMPDAVSASSSPGNIFIPTIGDGEKSVSITNMTNHIIIDGSVTVTGFTLTQPVGDEDTFSIVVAGNVVGTYTFTHESPIAAGFTHHFRFDHEAANTTVEVVANDLEPEERWFIDTALVNAVQPPLDINLEDGAVVVPSTMNGKRHWVGVKEPNGKVRIDAAVDGATVTRDEAKRNIVWENANKDGNDPLKASVGKDAPRHVGVLAKVGQATARADVWVVWANVTGSAPQKLPDQPIVVSGVPQGVTIGFKRQTTFTIHPAELFDLSQDVPALNGPNVKPDIPGFGPAGGALAAGVNARWDNSRRITIRAGTDIAGGFNLPADPFVDYPLEDWIGNDDESVFGEDNDPYDAPGRGKLTQEDIVFRQGPGAITMQGGNPGDFYTSKLWFEDFCRLQLGPDGSAQWFRISDFSPWRVEFHFKKIALKETDWNADADGDGSVTDRIMMENDVGWGPAGRDMNGDGDVLDQLGTWVEDPDFGSFGQNDNVGIPLRGQ